MNIAIFIRGFIVGLIAMAVIRGIIGAKCTRTKENKTRCFFAAVKYDFYEMSSYLDVPTFERKMIMAYCVVGIVLMTALIAAVTINMIAALM